jgi:hypothetical protein
MRFPACLHTFVMGNPPASGGKKAEKYLFSKLTVDQVCAISPEYC